METEKPLDNQLSMILGSFSAKHRKQAIPGFLTLCNLIPCLSSCQLAFTEHPSNAQHCPRVTGEVKAVHLPMRNLWSWWGGQTTVPRKTPQSTQDHGEVSVRLCTGCEMVQPSPEAREGGGGRAGLQQGGEAGALEIPGWLLQVLPLVRSWFFREEEKHHLSLSLSPAPSQQPPALRFTAHGLLVKRKGRTNGCGEG